MKLTKEPSNKSGASICDVKSIGRTKEKKEASICDFKSNEGSNEGRKLRMNEGKEGKMQRACNV